MNQELTVTRVCVGLLVIVPFLLTQVSGAEPALTFSGELQEVTAVSIAIRLTDGRIIEARNTTAPGNSSPRELAEAYRAARGDLSGRKIAETYTVGDEVEITCTAIRGVYYSVIDHDLILDLKKLRFLRKPSSQERAKALASRAWRFRGPDNLLYFRSAAQLPGGLPRSLPPLQARAGQNPEPASEWSTTLERIRSHVLAFVSRMPNFVADEVAERFESTSAPPQWRPFDTIESEITFRGRAESRQHILLSGKPWNQPYTSLPGSTWGSGFGADLPHIFDPNCPTTFEPGGQVREGGKVLSVIRFSSPPDGCVGYVYSGYQSFFAGQTGRILLDEQEENVIRFEENSQGFPKAFPVSTVEEQVSWGYVSIGDATYLLPVSSRIVHELSSGRMELARQEYKNHRHFEASSTLAFSPPDPPNVPAPALSPRDAGTYVRPASVPNNVVTGLFLALSGACVKAPAALSGNTVTVSRVSLCGLIRTAYDVPDYRISGVPSSMTRRDPANFYDVRAVGEGEGTLNEDQMRTALQKLLADRFHVTLHRETRDVPVSYLLKIGKGGSPVPRKLSTAALPCAPRSPQPVANPAFADVASFSVCGPVEPWTTAHIAQVLSRRIDSPVEDKTGLTGAYSFALQYTPEGAAIQPSAPPSLLTAVQQQLGLELEPQKARMEILVIDRAERPVEK